MPPRHGAPVAASNVRVLKELYQFSHGRAPRGDGAWAFRIGSVEPVRFIKGTYTAASAEARRIAASYGEREVEVLP